MAARTIVLLSQDPVLAGELAGICAGQCNFRVAPQIQKLIESEADSLPAGVILDARHPRDGGHSCVRAFESLRQLDPTLNLALITDDNYPESLERLVQCHGVARISAADSELSLLSWLDGIEGRADSRCGIPHKAPAAATFEPPSSMASRVHTQTVQFRRMLDELEVAAQHDVTILLIGETGAGKTFLSRMIHEASPRRQEPFLPVACGALSDELIESELFGHAKGAFTSAHADKDGKFLAAGRGTILLDEIDVLSLDQQVKLLRILETGEFEPVGSNRTLISEARVVVASNLDLEPLVQAGKFRMDLYYRLNMLKFHIPPLRRRKPDLRDLAERLVKQAAEKHKVVIRKIDEDVFRALVEYPWPGNVRELEHVMQRAVIYCRDGVLTTRHLPPHVLAGLPGPGVEPTSSIPIQQNRRRNLEAQVAVSERDIIEQALFRNAYSRTNTARDLGISRVTLYNKIKKLGISLKPGKDG